jgi:Rps23 Pro-64 3,4-dihydroxylase Tpa1-like proline 4-hydroxylase
MASVTAGCLTLWTTAYLEGRAPLNGSCKCLDTNNGANSVQGRSSERTSPIFQLNSKQCHELQSTGFLVVDEFLTAAQVQDARESIEWDRFQPNASHADDKTVVRTDLVYFQSFNEGSVDDVFENGTTSKENGMRRTQGLMRSVGYAITTSEFSGFRLLSTAGKGSEAQKFVTYNRHRLFVPNQMQVSLYQPGGTFYKEHTDTCSDYFLDLGLVGYLRSWYLQKRYLTCIVYLNDAEDDWKEMDGGCLRIFHSDSLDSNARRKEPLYTDVKPESGRMVLFSSEAIRHAVLPTFAPRLACSLWFTLQ